MMLSKVLSAHHGSKFFQYITLLMRYIFHKSFGNTSSTINTTHGIANGHSLLNYIHPHVH